MNPGDQLAFLLAEARTAHNTAEGKILVNAREHAALGELLTWLEDRNASLAPPPADEPPLCSICRHRHGREITHACE